LRPASPAGLTRQGRLRVFLDAEAGELRFTINELQISAVPGMHYIVYTPRDDQTRDRLADLS
jgi:hypothetical protein